MGLDELEKDAKHRKSNTATFAATAATASTKDPASKTEPTPPDPPDPRSDQSLKRKPSPTSTTSPPPKAPRTSFWIPSQTPTTAPLPPSATPPKLHPLCPGSGSGTNPAEKHALSLKGLVDVHFQSANGNVKGGEGKKGLEGGKYVCPSCSRGLSNSLGGVVAVPCGHVVCKSCVGRFGDGEEGGGDPHAGGGKGEVGGRCYVCEGVLRGVGKKGEGKGWVELRCEGTGFAGGGGNMVKARGTAFQC